jgi:calcineurin-like phosphoesterase family protein
MIYYTADLHFGDEEARRRSTRPFEDVAAMDEALVAAWNAVVGECDTVYVLGDLAAAGAPIPEAQLARLAGEKHLVRGNHDTGLARQERLWRYFESVTDFLEVDDAGIHVVMCHYPIIHVHRGYMVHGHLHASKGEPYRILKGLGHVMNAGVDVNGYRPVALAELVANNARHYGGPARGDWEHESDPGFLKGNKAVFLPLPERPREGGDA